MWVLSWSLDSLYSRFSISATAFLYVVADERCRKVIQMKSDLQRGDRNSLQLQVQQGFILVVYFMCLIEIFTKDSQFIKPFLAFSAED
jgi:hypothetical protein